MRNLVPIMMTIIAGLCLMLLPMPSWALWARPAWLLMILIFWTLRVPYEANVGYAFFAGICLDFLTGTMLGLHALAMTVVIYLVYRSSSKNKYVPAHAADIKCVYVCIYLPGYYLRHTGLYW